MTEDLKRRLRSLQEWWVSELERERNEVGVARPDCERDGDRHETASSRLKLVQAIVEVEDLLNTRRDLCVTSLSEVGVP